MNIEKQLPIVEVILSEYRSRIGGDFDAYRNHVYRVVNLCFSLGQEASRYLNAKGKGAWNAEVVEMIERHHCIRSCKDSSFALVDVFRRADIADFSLGMVAMGIQKELIAQLKADFPKAGFHKRLLQLGTKWLFKHPLNPLPMFRR